MSGRRILAKAGQNGGKIDHPKESLQLLDHKRLGLVLDCSHPVQKWPNPLLCNMMAKKLDFLDCKLTLLSIDDQASRPEAAKNFLHILPVLLQGLTGHNNVIKVDKDEGKSGQNSDCGLRIYLPCFGGFLHS